MSTNPTPPASDSAIPFTSSGAALPKTRNRAGFPRRSANTRNKGNKSGRNYLVDHNQPAQPVQGQTRSLQPSGSSKSK